MRLPPSIALVLVSVWFVLVAGCGARQSEPLDAQIDAIFRPAADKGNFSGNVLVTRRDRTLYEKSFGDADTSQANSADTRFLVFSIAKPFTAVLVFQQIDAGKLHLTDRLDSFWPVLRDKPAGAITLQQLLTHTSGLPEVISDHRDRRITPADLASAPVKAGAEFAYSSTGYVCLAMVLENATGQSYESLLQEKILDPAGMKESGLERAGKTVPGLARGHRHEGGKVVAADPDIDLAVLDGAGSLYTTARDLWRFDQALAGGKLLSKPSQALMLTEQVKGRYGYGWFLSEQGGKYFPWHKGDFRGHAAILVRQVHQHETIVILANVEEADVLGLRTKVLRLLKATPDGAVSGS